jgi:hypothetical protein
MPAPIPSSNHNSGNIFVREDMKINHGFVQQPPLQSFQCPLLTFRPQPHNKKTNKKLKKKEFKTIPI